MSGENVARICAETPGLVTTEEFSNLADAIALRPDKELGDEIAQLDCRDAAEWLEKMADAIGSARSHPRDPKLRLLKRLGSPPGPEE